MQLYSECAEHGEPLGNCYKKRLWKHSYSIWPWGYYLWHMDYVLLKYYKGNELKIFLPDQFHEYKLNVYPSGSYSL